MKNEYHFLFIYDDVFGLQLMRRMLDKKWNIIKMVICLIQKLYDYIQTACISIGNLSAR